jgi:uncharacterized protein
MTTSPEFSFPVNELDPGGKSFQLPVRAAWLRGALEGTSIGAPERDGELELRLSRSGTDVVVRGALSSELVVPCSRCLDPTVVLVREEISVLAVPKGAGSPAGARGPKDKKDKKPKDADDLDAADLTSEEADVILYEGDHLVLDELVRDELLLGIPMIPLCSEACPGISPENSASEEGAGIDPRLLPLLKLKNKT